MTTPEAGAREAVERAVAMIKDDLLPLLQGAQEALAGDAVILPGWGVWSVGRFEDVWRLAEPFPAAIRLLRLCSSRPGEWVPFSDVAGDHENAARNDMARFGRVLNAAGFPHRPFESKQFAKADYKMAYRIPSSLADLAVTAQRNLEGT